MNWLQIPRGQKLFESGDNDLLEFFLLHGEVELISDDGIRHRIDQDHPSAKRQLSRLRPRQFTAVTLETCELVSIESHLLESLQYQIADTTAASAGYGVSEVDSVEEAESQGLLEDFRSALQRNQFVLPSLPEVALKVRHLLEDENSSADMIASAINADPAIAAKLIRAANSPIYHGTVPCDSTRNSIVRLGLETTRQLVVSFAVRDLFTSKSPQLHKSMLKVWRHSVEVAAISFVVARMVKSEAMSAEEAMLAGLVHDIGVIAIVAYIDSQKEDKSVDELDTITKSLRAEVGEMILRRWNFPAEIVTAARHARSWKRQHDGSADICDVVQIAKLHSYIRDKIPLPVAQVDEVPAFHQLPLGDLTPELSIHILDEAREQIAAIKQVLSG